MRSQLLLVITAITAAAMPLAAAGPLGQLDSDAPIALYGSSFAGGTHLRLYHLAFEQGSFTGVLYSGSIIDFESRTADPCIQQEPTVREQARTLATVSPNTPDPISFEFEADSVAIADFGEEYRAFAGTDEATAFEREDSTPVAFVGPNPYVVDEPRDGFNPGPEYVRVLPTDPFLVIPTRPISMAFDGPSSWNSGT